MWLSYTPGIVYSGFERQEVTYRLLMNTVSLLTALQGRSPQPMHSNASHRLR